MHYAASKKSKYDASNCNPTVNTHFFRKCVGLVIFPVAGALWRSGARFFELLELP